MRVIHQLAGRPTIFKAVVCSFVLHAGALSVTCFWRARPTSEFSFDGRRDAIHVSATFSEAQPDPPERPVLIEEQAASAPDVMPRELPLSRREVAVEAERPEAAVELWSAAQKPAAAAPRRAEPVAAAARSAPALARRPRRSAPTPAPQSLAAVAQSAGLQDKTQPDFSGNRPPRYPPEAVRRGLQGTVLLRLWITERGRVERAEVSKSSGHAILDRVALSAVSRWRGRPARRSGRPVATDALLPVRFRLR